MKQRRKMAILFTLACVFWVGLRWANSQARPHALGLRNGRLAHCPNRPNCVSTQANDPEQQMPPIPLEESANEALGRLEMIIRSMPGTRVVSSHNGYLHAEFRSLLLGFVDDVELRIDETEKLVHFRSASRVGYSDLGVNRVRMENIRRRYQNG